MNDLLEILKFKEKGLSERKIAKIVGCGRTSVGKYLEMAEKACISYSDVKDMDPMELSKKFRDLDLAKVKSQIRPLPDFDKLGLELKKHPHLTLYQLWTEYKEEHPDGLMYSQFAYRFKEFKKINSAVMP